MYQGKNIWSEKEKRLFKKLDSPKKIQDFLVRLKHNPAKDKVECRSPRQVLLAGKAHCMEGAVLAAAILEFHGKKPLLMDLRSTGDDLDHVVALFRQFGCWGAISKTNHAVLRYREPIYKTLCELALSYFHEYFLDSGKKTLREYSRPFDLRYFDYHPALILSPSTGREKGRAKTNWRTTQRDLVGIPDILDEIKHYKILSQKQIRSLRKADLIEIKAGKLIQYNS